MRLLSDKGRWPLMALSTLAVTSAAIAFDPATALGMFSPPTLSKSHIRTLLSPQIRQNQFPETITGSAGRFSGTAHIDYTIDQHLQQQADKLLASYKPDYGAIVMLDAQTGEILTMASFQKGTNNSTNWNLKNTFPAASIFKVITATTAVEKAGIHPETKIFYNGGAYTLYKKNVLSDKVTRWTNIITLKDAFARSINTAFGRLSLEKLKPQDLAEYSSRFMFNKEIESDFEIEMGQAEIPDIKGYRLAEVASGFNKANRMSPVQGALIAAIIANDGVRTIPYLVKKATNHEGKVIYQNEKSLSHPIMSKASANKVQTLMERTISNGTSRRTFRPLARDRNYKTLDLGGKTGHLNSNDLKSQVDWFVGYAKNQERKIAVAAITVNKKFWTVKSGHLAQTMLKNYYKQIKADRR